MAFSHPRETIMAIFMKVHAAALLAAAVSIAAPAFAQARGGPAGNMTDQKAQDAENDAARTLNNTPPANGSPDANAIGRSAGARTRHAMGVGSSGGNNAPAATNDAQSQATRELNQQPSTPSSANGPTGSDMK